MEKNINIIKMKPEFIYLDNGMAISTDNIVSIDEYNNKVIFGYGVAMLVTSHDIDVIKENIDIINDESQCHCGQDAEEEAKELPGDMAELLTDGYKNHCRQALEDFLDRKITWWQFKKEMLMPDFVDWVKSCGQDAEEEPSISLKDLLGMEVVGVGKGKCDGCPMGHYQADCCKVELVGGDYICLAKPKPEEEDGDNVMGDIKEKVEEFIDYLDSVVGN